MKEIVVAEDPRADAARRLTEAAAQGGHIVLTGGSTPRRAYELAAREGADWSGATAWFSDERCVPPDDPRSNYRMADQALLSRLRRPPAVMRMKGELGHVAGAGDYEARLREHLGSDPRFDFVLLGLGPDGHTSSLFPGKPELEVLNRFVVGVPLAGMEPQVPRLTLTFPALNGAHDVVFLVTGEDKAEAVRRAFGEPPDPEAPAARVSPPAGTLTVVLDEAAAKGLAG
jgi:6-phosphogluconolactonase